MKDLNKLNKLNIQTAEAEPVLTTMKEFNVSGRLAEPDRLDTLIAQAADRDAASARAVDEAMAKLDEAKAKEAQWIYAARGFLVSLALLILAGLLFAKSQHLSDREFYTSALYAFLIISVFTAITFPSVSVAYLNLLERVAYKGKHVVLVSVVKGVLYLVALIGFAVLLSFLGGRIAAF